MATLQITRKNEWVGRLRGFKVILDDREAGKVSNGESIELTIPEGIHKLKFKIDWCGSKEHLFSVAAGETKRVNISHNKYVAISIYAGAGLVALHYMVRVSTGF